jgi:hypothetical protein
MNESSARESEVTAETPVKPPASEAGAARNDQGCCSHLRVSYRTREEGVGHVVTAWWECDSGCGARFTVAPPASEAGHREDSDEGLDPLPPATLAETPAWDALVERIAEELYHSDCFPEHGPVGARKPHTFAQMPESTASEYRHMARCVMPVVEEHIRALVWAKAEAEALVMSHEGRLERAEQRVRDLEGALERVKRHRLFRTMFESAPCILCGYSGPGYYQPDAHPCAKVYHAALRGTGEGSNAPQ